MGNSGSMTLNGAQSAAPPPPPNDCKTLNSRNVNQRGTLAGDPAKYINEQFGSNGASTVAHASLNGAAPVGAVSRLLPQRYKHLVEGLWANTTKAQRKNMRKTGRSNLCPTPAFLYGQSLRPHQSHCESKILETLFSKPTKPTGTLLININWQSLADPNSKVPCPSCRKLLCHAQQHCDLNILLCKKDPAAPPQPLVCP